MLRVRNAQAITNYFEHCWRPPCTCKKRNKILISKRKMTRFCGQAARCCMVWEWILSQVVSSLVQATSELSKKAVGVASRAQRFLS